jgi:hypothetical protein
MEENIPELKKTPLQKCAVFIALQRGLHNSVGPFLQ